MRGPWGAIPQGYSTPADIVDVCDLADIARVATWTAGNRSTTNGGLLIAVLREMNSMRAMLELSLINNLFGCR